MRPGFVRLALTQSGFLLGLSPAIVGFLLGRTLGTARALSSIAAASAGVVLLGLCSASLAVGYREPTAALARHFLGRQGARLVGLALAVSFVGWLRIHALAIEAAADGHPAQSPALLAFCALASVVLVRRSNAWIARLSAVQGPALMALFAYTWTRLGVAPLTGLRPERPDLAAVLLIVAAGLSDVIDMPTLLHVARSRAAALASVAVTYGLVLPGLLAFGVFVASDPAAPTLVAALAAGGPRFAVTVKVLLVGSATVANAGLLWSGGTSLATAFARSEAAPLRWGMSALGLLLSLTVVGASVEAVLSVLGAVTGGVGFVVLTAYLLDGARAQRERTTAQRRAHAVAAAAAAGFGLVALGLARRVGAPEASGILVAAAAGVLSTALVRASSRRSRPPV